MRKVLLLILLLALTAAALERQPNADYRARRAALSLKINAGEVVVLFAPIESAGPNAVYGFRQDNNFYYLSGLTQPGAALLIAPETKADGNTPRRPYTEILFLPAPNYLQQKWTGPQLGPESPNVAQITGFDHVEGLEKMRDELARLLPEPRSVVYSDLPEFLEESASTAPLEWLRRANAFVGFVTFKDVKPILGEMRKVKDAGELALIRKAVEASMAAHQAAMKAMRPGITEREISALMQYEFGRRGCERPAYAPIVGAGFNSTVLHYSEDSGTVAAGDVVVIDVGGECSMYAADITRTLPATGKFTPRQREIYGIVLGAQQAAVNAFQAGHSKMLGEEPDTLYNIALEYINSHGKDLHGQPLGKYFIHGLGHYVGLHVHDAGTYTTPLDKGMVFTLEPGIYIPEEKIGVRIEDMFYVNQSGRLEKLTAGLPSTADEVERAMAGK